jgi:Predicted membrane protein
MPQIAAPAPVAAPVGGGVGGGGGRGGGGGGAGGVSEAEKLQQAIEKANESYAKLIQKFTEGSTPLKEQLADQEKLNELRSGGVALEQAQQMVDREREILNIRKEGVEALEDLRAIENLTADKLVEGEERIKQLVQERIDLQNKLNQAKDATAAKTASEEKGESAAKDRLQQAQSDASGLASTLSGGLKNAIVTAIKGGDVGQAMAGLAEQMGQKFLDIAFVL